MKVWKITLKFFNHTGTKIYKFGDFHYSWKIDDWNRQESIHFQFFHLYFLFSGQISPIQKGCSRWKLSFSPKSSFLIYWLQMHLTQSLVINLKNNFVTHYTYLVPSPNQGLNNYGFNISMTNSINALYWNIYHIQGTIFFYWCLAQNNSQKVWLKI